MLSYGKNRYYILRGEVVQQVSDHIVWGRWMETHERLIAKADIGDGVRVSTVFLGLDHNYGEGPPILFETMVFGLPDGEEYMSRYSTIGEAVDGHEKTVALMRERFREQEI